MLTVLDEYTRQALCVVARPRMGSAEVLEALYPLLLRHGKPTYIRSDNGPEFIATALQTWLKKVGIKPIHEHEALNGAQTKKPLQTKRLFQMCTVVR